MNITDLLLFLILIVQVTMLFQLRRIGDFTVEDEEVKRLHKDVTDAQKRIPPEH